MDNVISGEHQTKYCSALAFNDTNQILLYFTPPNTFTCHLSPLVQNQLRRGELKWRGNREERKREMGWEKKKDRILFHNHTYLRPTLPFRFPPFPEHH